MRSVSEILSLRGLEIMLSLTELRTRSGREERKSIESKMLMDYAVERGNLKMHVENISLDLELQLKGPYP